MFQKFNVKKKTLPEIYCTESFQENWMKIRLTVSEKTYLMHGGRQITDDWFLMYISFKNLNRNNLFIIYIVSQCWIAMFMFVSF